MNKKLTENIFTKSSGILAAAVICTFLWGSAYPGVKIGYELFHISPEDVASKILFAGYRFTIAGIIVIVFQSILKKRLVYPKRSSILPIIMLGLVQTTAEYIFFYIGLSNTTGVKGSVLNASGTFMAVLLAHFIYKDDKLSKNKIMGCLIGFLGVVIINLSGGSIGGGFRLTGEGFIIIAAFAFAVGFILTKWATRSADSMVVTGYQLTIGGIVLILIGKITQGTLKGFDHSAIWLLIYLALLSSIAFTLWAQLLKYNPVGKISVYNFLIPIFGAVLSSVFLGENFWNIRNFAALILVSTGIYIVNRKKQTA